jgi:DNA-binding NarL/FixJ family response regulator
MDDEKRTTTPRRSITEANSSGVNSRCAHAYGMRFRWGGTYLVLFSIPLKERPPAPTALGQVAQHLSQAERTVVELADQGYSNAEIAQRRNTAVATTKKQLESAYRKLGVSSRAELAALLARHGRDDS